MQLERIDEWRVRIALFISLKQRGVTVFAIGPI